MGTFADVISAIVGASLEGPAPTDSEKAYVGSIVRVRTGVVIDGDGWCLTFERHTTGTVVGVSIEDTTPATGAGRLKLHVLFAGHADAWPVDRDLLDVVDCRSRARAAYDTLRKAIGAGMPYWERLPRSHWDTWADVVSEADKARCIAHERS